MPTPLLSATQLARMQAAVATTLPDTCDVLRYSSTPDGAGGVIETWSTIHSAVACRFVDYEARKGGEEQQVHERFDSVLWWRVTLPAGTDVLATDRLVFQGRTFEVISLGVGKSWEIETHAMASEIT